MNLVYNLIALGFTIAFFILMFFVAWYIALPLLIIGIFIALTQQVVQHFRHRHPHHPSPKKTDNPQIIDVEYTEL